MMPFAQRDSVEQVELGLALAPKFDADGLLPAIVIDTANQQVLMLGYMNADALEKTISTRLAHFWSRSRQSLWRKGEHSGFAQRVDKMLIDDDQDAVILYVAVDGPGSCHVGFTSCFYRAVDLEGDETEPVSLTMVVDTPAFDAAAVYDGLPNPTRL
jgi:phosphoribosyl-AMP cyclohydrolase